MDTSVGPFRVEVLEGLKKVRFVLEPNEHGIAADLTWEGAIPAFLEPRQFIRKYGRVLFDTQRFAQTGYWSGTLEVGGESFAVTPDRWWGTRDRSWGVRPVGEKEPPGIRQGEGQMGGMWNYAPMQFDDFSILYILNEADDGERPLEEANRIWNDPAREPEQLGRPEYEHTLVPGTRMIASSVISFPDAPGGGFEVKVDAAHARAHRRGYRLRHGGGLAPRHVPGPARRAGRSCATWTSSRSGAGTGSSTTSPASSIDDQVGYGLHEHGFFGPYRKYGLERRDDGAP